MRGIAIAALLLALGGGVWLIWSSVRSASPSGAAAPTSAFVAPSAPPASGTVDGALGGTDELAPAQRRGALAASAAEEGDFDLDRALWVEGRVVFPFGSPPDETLAVVAIPISADAAPTRARAIAGRAAVPDWSSAVAEASGWSRRAVSADGSFRAPLPAGTTRARLLLDGRFLYLAEAVELELGGARSALRLEPLLGGALLVRCAPPPRRAGEAELLAGVELRLNGMPRGMGLMGMGGGSVARRLALPADLAVEFRGLPADHRYFIDADPLAFPGARLLDVEVEGGRSVVREIVFDEGVHLAGLVVDPRGERIAGATVSARPQGQMAMMIPGAHRETQSDADGSFELRGVPARRLRVRASMPGRIAAESEELRPREGETASGLRLVLDRGLSISGRVRYPDGSAAAGALVRLAPVGAEDARERQEGSADAEGRFEIHGLAPGSTYDLAASAAGPGSSGEQGAGARTWRARRAALSAGTAEVEVQLDAPSLLEGRVVEAGGAPVGEFRVTVLPTGADVAGRNRRSSEVRSDDGRFELEDLPRGEWTVSIEAAGYAMAEDETKVRVPVEGPELVVVLIEAASILGTVIDPSGAPVAGASVRLTKGEEPRMGRGMARAGQRNERTESDERGAFTLAALRPGTFRLAAADGTFAPSEALTLTLAPGEVASGIVLQLRVGGTVTGEIYRADGLPDANRTIMSWSMAESDGKSALSDAAGRFRIEHLAPGSHMVMAQPDLARLGELEREDRDLDPIDFMSSMKMASVEVADGETAHVVLGAPPRDPVRVFGRVTEAGRPVGEGSVMVVSEGRAVLEAWKPARVQSDGTYELVLDEPGDVLVAYQARAFEEGGVEFHAHIPEAREHRLDLELPTGRIEGVVQGPDGAPLAREMVSIERETGLRGMASFGGAGGVRSDAAGRFRFERLRPATYTLRAGGGYGQADAGWGGALLAGVAVGEGQRVDGLVLRLSRPGSLRGRVVGSDGRPVAGAAVFVRDASGRLVESFSTATTDADGAFTHPRLAPGEVTVSARTASAASAELGPVRIREGGETEVQLALEEGTILRVVVEDAEGRALRVALSVRDEAGRELAGMRSAASMQADFAEGISTSEQRVGPLPPGRYEVVATTPEGATEKRTLRLTGRSERKLRIRIGD